MSLQKKHNPITNTADEVQIEAAAKVEKRKDFLEKDDLKSVLVTLEGRRWLWGLLNHCGVFGTVFSQDQNLMSWRSGRQDVGHWVMSKITEAHEDAFQVMMSESKKGVYDV